MLDVIKHSSGIVISVKTFKPLLIFPWTCAIWRQFPFRTAVATIAFRSKMAAADGHRQVVALLRNLTIGPDMRELFVAIENYVKANSAGVKSFRVYPGHEVEGKVAIKITEKRPQS
jgi:hypothetical protein